jgi:uncharacterized membrane protein HdeD (DUF308 family)/predicted flap endonuclease-1-like 5' DNA nuclease
MNTNQPKKQKQTPVAWWAALIEAVVALVLGTLLLFHGQAAPLILIQFLGLYFLIKGLLSFAAIFTNPRGWFLKFIIGILGLAAGILLLDHPFWRGLQSENNLVYLIAGVAFAIGVVTLFQVFVNGGFSSILLGFISILIGLTLIWTPAIFMIPPFIGLLLITTGIILMIKSLSLFYALPGQTEVLHEAEILSQEPEPKLIEDTSPVVTAAVIADVSEYTYPETVEEAVDHPETIEELQEPEQPASELDWAIAEKAAVEETGVLTGGGLGAAAVAVAAIAHEAGDETAGSSEEAIEPTSADQIAEPVIIHEVVSGQTEAPVDESSLQLAEASESVEPQQPEEEIPQAESIEVVEPQDSEPTQTVDFDLGADEKRYLTQDISYVEGIGPVFAEKLKSVGVLTALDLLKSGSTRKGRADLVSHTGISPKLILRWVNQADLFRVKGIGSEYGELLEAAGVDTVVELSGRKPENLHLALLSVNEEKKLVRKTPTLSQVQAWIERASKLPRIIRY